MSVSAINYLRLLKDFIPNSPNFTVDDFPDLTGRVYIVTGASSGLGLQVARRLIQKNAKVYLMAKTKSKLDNALKDLSNEFPDNADNIYLLVVDYADLRTIKSEINKFLQENDRLDGIVHNAGMNFSPWGATTEQGIEFTIGVNGVGPHLVQKYLDDILIKTAQTASENSVRIVWVSSSGHRLSVPVGGIHIENLNNVPNGILRTGIYGHSKTVNIYQSIIWPKKHGDSKVVSVSVNPGFAATDITRTRHPVFEAFLNMFTYNAEKAAYAELYPLLHPSITLGDNGKYYIPFGNVEYPRQDIYDAANGEMGERLWEWLDEQVAPFL